MFGLMQGRVAPESQKELRDPGFLCVSHFVPPEGTEFMKRK